MDLLPLQEKIADVIYYSETDSPFTIEILQSKSPGTVAEEIAQKNDITVSGLKQISAALFFQQIHDTADPNDVAVVTNAQKIVALYNFLQSTFTDLSVYRVEGGVRIPIYITCFSGNECIALKTLSVES